MEQKTVGIDGTKVLYAKSKDEMDEKEILYEYFRNSPVPEDLMLEQLSLYITRQNLSDILYYDNLYKKILDKHGVICDLGVFYGRTMCLFEALRGIYEPYNHSRKIIGFDTFEGFLSSSGEGDGKHDIVKKGNFATIKGYEQYLEKLLISHEKRSPISHLKKFEVIKGDATVTLKKYLEDNPETIIAFAHFTLSLYEPTKKCLELVLPHLTRGAIISFGAISNHAVPGVTRAFDEVLGINRYMMHKDSNSPDLGYIVFDGELRQ